MKLPLILTLMAFSLGACFGGIFPAKTEINLAAVPIDKYFNLNSQRGVGNHPELQPVNYGAAVHKADLPNRNEQLHLSERNRCQVVPRTWWRSL